MENLLKPGKLQEMSSIIRSKWHLKTFVLSNQPILAGRSKPSHILLAIPWRDSLEFQIMAAITLNHIWFARNKLFHNANSTRALLFIEIDHPFFKGHFSAWTSSPSLLFGAPPLPPLRLFSMILITILFQPLLSGFLRLMSMWEQLSNS